MEVNSSYTGYPQGYPRYPKSMASQVNAYSSCSGLTAYYRQVQPFPIYHHLGGGLHCRLPNCFWNEVLRKGGRRRKGRGRSKPLYLKCYLEVTFPSLEKIL